MSSLAPLTLRIDRALLRRSVRFFAPPTDKHDHGAPRCLGHGAGSGSAGQPVPTPTIARPTTPAKQSGNTRQTVGEGWLRNWLEVRG
jgi:hypothetical protein